MTTAAPPSEDNISYSDNAGKIGPHDNSISDLNISGPNFVTLNGTSKIKTKEEERNKMREIWVICEAKQQMHILSSVSFLYWYTTYHLFTLDLLIILSGIVYFLANTNTIPDTAKQYLSISVGILSMISSFVQSLNQEYKYDS